MPKYKVGDISALFPKPKEPTTEAGKKLESLFKEFHAKKNKFRGSFPQNTGSQIVTLKSENTNSGIENERLPKKNKKRKFDDAILSTETSQLFSEEQSKKKFKEEPKSIKKSMLREKRKFPTEKGFPRNKKSSKVAKSKFIKNYNELGREETEYDNDFDSSQSFNKGTNIKKLKKTKGLDDLKDSVLSNEVNQFLSEQGFSKNKKKFKFGANDLDESANNTEEGKNVHSDIQESNKFKSKNKKQKFKKMEQVISSHIIENKESKNLLNSSSTFKNKIKNFIKKSPKDFRKHDEEGSKQNSQSPNANLNPKNEGNKEHDESNNVELLNDNSAAKNVKDFVRNKNFKKKVKSNFGSKSEETVYGKETDFIPIPDIKKPEFSEDELSRTLFVGNLPLDTKTKELKKLFARFGEVENVRFQGNVTDKAKLFSENGFKSKIRGKNYAADSVPGYIVYTNKESAIIALSLSGTLFKGHHITVDFALPAGSHKHYDGKRSIFIGNLPFDCKDDSVWELFSGCGRIESVRIVRDKQTGIGKGFGFVQFDTIQSREKALSLDDLEIQGRPIRMKEVSDNKTAQKKTKEVTAVKQSNTFKSHAIRLKKKSKDSTSRKSVTKIMKKQKRLHEKKKISSILLKSMKK